MRERPELPGNSGGLVLVPLPAKGRGRVKSLETKGAATALGLIEGF